MSLGSDLPSWHRIQPLSTVKLRNHRKDEGEKCSTNLKQQGHALETRDPKETVLMGPNLIHPHPSPLRGGHIKFLPHGASKYSTPPRPSPEECLLARNWERAGGGLHTLSLESCSDLATHTGNPPLGRRNRFPVAMMDIDAGTPPHTGTLHDSKLSWRRTAVLNTLPSKSVSSLRWRSRRTCARVGTWYSEPPSGELDVRAFSGMSPLHLEGSVFQKALRRCLESRNTSFQRVRPPSRAPYAARWRHVVGGFKNPLL